VLFDALAKHDAVAPFRLGTIQSLVGRAQEVFHSQAVVGEDSHPDRERHGPERLAAVLHIQAFKASALAALRRLTIESRAMKEHTAIRLGTSAFTAAGWPGTFIRRGFRLVST
jgi:hypothetical protein